MDDLYAINAAKTEFREGFNLADASRILAIPDPDLVNFSDGQPGEFGETGLDALKTRVASLFERLQQSCRRLSLRFVCRETLPMITDGMS